jgi:hypothetical protein
MKTKRQKKDSTLKKKIKSRIAMSAPAVTVTASMLLTKASGYLALKNPFKRTLFLFFVIFFFNVLSFFFLFVFIVQVRVSQIYLLLGPNKQRKMEARSSIYFIIKKTLTMATKYCKKKKNLCRLQEHSGYTRFSGSSSSVTRPVWSLLSSFPFPLLQRVCSFQACGLVLTSLRHSSQEHDKIFLKNQGSMGKSINGLLVLTKFGYRKQTF